jgi:hypothetical protein
MPALVLFQLVVGIFFNFFTFRLHSWRQNSTDLKTLPTIFEFLSQVTFDVGFVHGWPDPETFKHVLLHDKDSLL